MREENAYLNVLAVEVQIAISGGISVRIPQKVDDVAFNFGISMSWFFSLEIPMSWDIELLWNSDPYASDIATSSKYSVTVGCFLFCIY